MEEKGLTYDSKLLDLAKSESCSKKNPFIRADGIVDLCTGLLTTLRHHVCHVLYRNVQRQCPPPRFPMHDRHNDTSFDRGCLHNGRADRE